MEDHMLATVSRWGNSLGIRIPASLAEASGIVEGDKVELRRTLNGDIILQRKKKERGELKGFGQLRQYANPALRAQEGEAFARAMDERFGKKGH